ncbi:paraneoplastic antigen Ma6E-like [Selaginella moellendorffii]|uniref:paraneoplastic antigen Ma6E-like n=1 Tax=Selaginella moellendorffii TaxID=88036 RepID=UPI000D1C8542|nr:paraneoplastic antigen Ma6E-like [Selaginella moellendorffii]|eukprot:XP_024539455.1 paraneoplastic antigen Ma6E-like [Selaginella moellendorffii]
MIQIISRTKETKVIISDNVWPGLHHGGARAEPWRRLEVGVVRTVVLEPPVERLRQRVLELPPAQRRLYAGIPELIHVSRPRIESTTQLPQRRRDVIGCGLLGQPAGDEAGAVVLLVVELEPLGGLVGHVPEAGAVSGEAGEGPRGIKAGWIGEEAIGSALVDRPPAVVAGLGGGSGEGWLVAVGWWEGDWIPGTSVEVAEVCAVVGVGVGVSAAGEAAVESLACADRAWVAREGLGGVEVGVGGGVGEAGVAGVCRGDVARAGDACCGGRRWRA